MIEKKRPNAKINFDFGNDGRDSKYYIQYTCPTCGQIIWWGYRSETACDQCGTIYDWGERKPIIIRTVDWS